MKNFRRSLKYAWAYRVRLGLAMLCIIAITVLWGGGLGLLGPAAEILISDGGLHGWAYDSITGDRLEARIIQMRVPYGTQIEPGRSINPILSLSKVAEDSAADKAGLQKGDWIIGIYDTVPEHRLMQGDAISRILASIEDDQPVILRVRNPLTKAERKAIVTLAPTSIGPRLLHWIVSKIPVPQTPTDTFYIFCGLLGISLGMTILRDLFRFTQEYLVETAVYRGIIDLRQETYNIALCLPLTFYSQEGTTDTISRLVKDTNVLARAQVTLFGKTIAEPAKAIGVLVMAFFFSWKLTLLALVAGPPAVFLIRRFGKRMKRASRKALEGWSTMLAVLEETLTGIRVVKAYTMEGTERKRFFRANRRLFRQQKKMAKIDAATGPAIEALGVTAASAAAALAGYWVLHGDMRTSSFLGLMGCLAAMFDPLRKLAKVVTRFQKADAAAARVFEVQDRTQERSIPGAPMLGRCSRSIELRGVSFRYPNAAEDALHDVNLTIEAGKTFAIVGPNGCGKTTLVSLIPRLIDPTAGEILIDGCDISQYSIRSVRRQIAVVTQDTVLFHATIAENIAYGLRRPKEANVLSAARSAFVDEFVRELPDGYDTMVGEHGATLSGGQKQRIAIARAILRDPAILIFDEATSQIDADSESRIHQAMDEFVKNRTTLMIAHRFATVLKADYIFVMNQGQIVAAGTHRELIESCDLYRHLYQTQLADAGA